MFIFLFIQIIYLGSNREAWLFLFFKPARCIWVVAGTGVGRSAGAQKPVVGRAGKGGRSREGRGGGEGWIDVWIGSLWLHGTWDVGRGTFF